MAGPTEFIETLAAEIGNRVYIDIAKWHLYLNDAHLHGPLAEQLYPLLSEDRLSEAAVRTVLEGFTVAIGGGAAQIPLLQLVPNACLQDLMELLDETRRDL